MRLYRCLVLNKENNKLEKIYCEKNKKTLLKKILLEENILIKILEIQFRKNIKEKELREVYLKIGRLLNAGLSLKKAIEFQKNNQKNLTLNFKIFNINSRLEKGEDIYEILKDEDLIKERELLIIFVSENVGKIGDGFLKIAYLKEKKEKLKNDLKIALSYPIFILFISTIIIILIFILIVPNFQILYDLNKDDLPLLTKIILKIKDIFSEYSYAILIIICVVFFCSKLQKVKRQLQRIPFIKKFLYEKYIINILDNLSILLEAGISIDKGVDIILDNLDVGNFKNKIYILRNLKKGETLSSCFKKLEILSLEEINMISVGEESSKIEVILKEISLSRNEVLERKIKIMLKLAEPILLLLIGILISIFVVGLYLPILNMNEILEI
ncbi:type II secretion system F family protein [Cetobacterium somerae]|uniref:type II secretion system F family protein n=1 Tax=Cetobacterium sp. NK01 TaxID=2993530 RepID=UPI0021166C04|nr:type II secretion system F family protein [Cetobacterium sp. NK01]MCQ8211927.1 type II secretion system F family protein [Cetobacterium sp. NK01]